MVGDPEQIRAVAARLRVDSERVRWLATRVQGTGELAWRSPAASVFRVRVAERANALRRCAGDLDTAARLVEVHAQAVSAAGTELARVGAAIAARVGARGTRQG